MMHPLARRLLGAAAAAVARKLLPDAVPNNPGTALARRADTQLARNTERHMKDFFPLARPSQTFSPPPAYYAPPEPAPPRRQRRIVIIEEITRRS